MILGKIVVLCTLLISKKLTDNQNTVYMSEVLEKNLRGYSTTTLKMGSYRINSIDVLRGLVMIIMALDHTRDFFHIGSLTEDPLNPATTTLPLYFTRWVTHFCAPTFVFLSGISIYLQGLRKTKAQLSSFLLKRGLWLIGIEVIVMTFCFTFNIHYTLFFLQVIWSIGISMVILSLLIRMPMKVILAIGLLIVFGHNLLDYYEANHQGQYTFLYKLIHRGNSVQPLWGNHVLIILYPFLPWTGLMLIGYYMGSLFKSSINPDYRRKFLLMLGAGMILFFAILRATNTYGNPFKWQQQVAILQTLFSFFNVQKYPPSLLFMCITIGPSLIFLALIENVRNKFTGILKVYGSVPFFYYILHFYSLHIVCMLLFLTRGYNINQGSSPNSPFMFVLPGQGYHLWTVYVIWISVVAALYPLCKWYSNYKSHHRSWWLSYL